MPLDAGGSVKPMMRRGRHPAPVVGEVFVVLPCEAFVVELSGVQAVVELADEFAAVPAEGRVVAVAGDLGGGCRRRGPRRTSSMW
jgi:hypothetical protein